MDTLTYTALLYRGWTAELIAEYLPQPLIYTGSDGEKLKLWERETVMKAEREYCLDVADNSPRWMK